MFSDFYDRASLLRENAALDACISPIPQPCSWTSSLAYREQLIVTNLLDTPGRERPSHSWVQRLRKPQHSKALSTSTAKIRSLVCTASKTLAAKGGALRPQARHPIKSIKASFKIQNKNSSSLKQQRVAFKSQAMQKFMTRQDTFLQDVQDGVSSTGPLRTKIVEAPTGVLEHLSPASTELEDVTLTPSSSLTPIQAKSPSNGGDAPGSLLQESTQRQTRKKSLPNEARSKFGSSKDEFLGRRRCTFPFFAQLAHVVPSLNSQHRSHFSSKIGNADAISSINFPKLDSDHSLVVEPPRTLQQATILPRRGVSAECQYPSPKLQLGRASLSSETPQIEDTPPFKGTKIFVSKCLPRKAWHQVYPLSRKQPGAPAKKRSFRNLWRDLGDKTEPSLDTGVFLTSEPYEQAHRCPIGFFSCTRPVTNIEPISAAERSSLPPAFASDIASVTSAQSVNILDHVPLQELRVVYGCVQAATCSIETEQIKWLAATLWSITTPAGRHRRPDAEKNRRLAAIAGGAVQTCLFILANSKPLPVSPSQHPIPEIQSVEDLVQQKHDATQTNTALPIRNIPPRLTSMFVAPFRNVTNQTNPITVEKRSQHNSPTKNYLPKSTSNEQLLPKVADKINALELTRHCFLLLQEACFTENGARQFGEQKGPHVVMARIRQVLGNNPTTCDWDWNGTATVSQSNIDCLKASYRLLFLTSVPGNDYSDSWLDAGAATYPLLTLSEEWKQSPLSRDQAYVGLALGVLRVLASRGHVSESDLGLFASRAIAHLENYPNNVWIAENAFAILAIAQAHCPALTKRMTSLVQSGKNIWPFLIDRCYAFRRDRYVLQHALATLKEGCQKCYTAASYIRNDPRVTEVLECVMQEEPEAYFGDISPIVRSLQNDLDNVTTDASDPRNSFIPLEADPSSLPVLSLLLARDTFNTPTISASMSNTLQPPTSVKKSSVPTAPDGVEYNDTSILQPDSGIDEMPTACESDTPPDLEIREVGVKNGSLTLSSELRDLSTLADCQAPENTTPKTIPDRAPSSLSAYCKEEHHLSDTSTTCVQSSSVSFILETPRTPTCHGSEIGVSEIKPANLQTSTQAVQDESLEPNVMPNMSFSIPKASELLPGSCRTESPDAATYLDSSRSHSAFASAAQHESMPPQPSHQFFGSLNNISLEAYAESGHDLCSDWDQRQETTNPTVNERDISPQQTRGSSTPNVTMSSLCEDAHTSPHLVQLPGNVFSDMCSKVPGRVAVPSTPLRRKRRGKKKSTRALKPIQA